MRFQFLLAIALAAGTSCTEAKPTSHRLCDDWRGAYVGQLLPTDTFTGLPTELHLNVQRNGVGWNVTGDGVPEIILEAERYQCTADRLTGRFSGSQDMRGTFTLTKRGASYTFDASDVGNGSDAGLNYLGYVPNRPIQVRRGQ